MSGKHSTDRATNPDNTDTNLPEPMTLTNYTSIPQEDITLLSTPFSPRKITENIALQLSTISPVRVHCYSPVEIPARLIGDPGIIQQILLRLAANAVKYTTEGEIYIGCEIVEMYEEAGLAIIRFEIRDTGTGIEANKLKELTIPHNDLPAPSTNHYSTKKMGLSIVEKLTQAMGGHFYIESAYKLGSRLWFDIPLGIQTADNQDTGLEKHNHLDGRYILIATDSETSQFILKSYLKAWNVRPIIATDKDETMLMLRNSLALNEPFYAIILDLNKPEANQELIEIIRGRKRHDSVPLIAVDTKSGTYSNITASIPAPLCMKQLYTLLNHGIKQSPDRKASTPSATSSEVKILLVESNKIDATITMTTLESIDAEVDYLQDENQLIQQIIDNSYHFILISIPTAETGFYNTGILKLLRTWEEHTVQENIPVIAMAPYIPGLKPAEYLKQDGANDYIAKPARKDEIIEVTTKWLAFTEKNRITKSLC